MINPYALVTFVTQAKVRAMAEEALAEVFKGPKSLGLGCRWCRDLRFRVQDRQLGVAQFRSQGRL